MTGEAAIQERCPASVTGEAGSWQGHGHRSSISLEIPSLNITLCLP